MFKVAIYCRISEEDKNKTNYSNDSESIQNQKSLLLKYIIDNNWDLYKIYVDENYSGIDNNRPEFNSLLKDAQDKKFDIILCKTQSRFTRDIEVVEKYLHNKFIEWGIRFVTVVDSVDTNDTSNRKMRQINGLVNQWYLEDLSDNIKLVLNSKMKDGKYIGASCPYGYKKSDNDKNKLEIDEEAAKVVKYIFDMYLNGYGINKIVNELNKDKIPNPTLYKKINGYCYHNPNSKYNPQNLWVKNTVRSILSNEIYIGNLIQGKTGTINYKSQRSIRKDKKKWIRVNNTHKPIIDKKDYFKVQERLKDNVKPQKKAGKIHIFSGKAFCMDCKSKLYKHISSNKEACLECRFKKYSNGKYIKNSIKIKDLENLVLDEIRKLICKFDIQDDIFTMIEVNDISYNKIKQLLKEKDNLNNEILKLNNAIETSYIDKVNHIISEDLFITLNSDFNIKIKNIENKINNIDNILIESKCIYSDKENIIKKYININNLDINIIDLFIDKIYLKVEDNGKLRYRDRVIEILWKI